MNWRKGVAIFLILVFIRTLLNGLTATGDDQTSPHEEPLQFAAETVGPADDETAIWSAAPADENTSFRTAPPFELEELHTGKLIGSESSDKPLLLNFWASWCEPCQMEAPHLVQLYKLYEEQLDLYAINQTDMDNVADAARFAEQYALPFPVLLDEEGKVADQYYVLTIPTSILIDEQKQIVSVHHGYADLEMFVLYVEELLQSAES